MSADPVMVDTFRTEEAKTAEELAQVEEELEEGEEAARADSVARAWRTSVQI